MIKKILVSIAILVLVGIITMFFYCNYQLSPVNRNNNKEIEVIITTGSSSKEIAKLLNEKKIIKNKNFFLLYLKLYKINNIKASTYKLKQSQSLKEIIKVITDGNGYNPNEITITFKEGKNIRSVATVISENTNNTYEDTMKKINDDDYVSTLIEKYWFLTNDINNNDIFYPLEGYLFPDTYIFKDKDVTVEEIITRLLDQTDKVLTKEKELIESSSLSIHEIITLSSIVELEGLKKEEKNDIASVFFNRLEKNISLGSDVTACYAQKIDDTTLCHNTADFNYNSPYNTRLSGNIGIPVGPIANPGLDSIKSVLNPNKTDYMYFVADKHTNVYFFKTYDEFAKKINELKKSGDWL